MSEREAGQQLDLRVSRTVFGEEPVRVSYLGGWTRPPKDEGNPAPEVTASGGDDDLSLPWNHPVIEETWIVPKAGQQLYSHFGCDGSSLKAETVPHYSQEAKAAWLVINQMEGMGWWLTLRRVAEPERWEASFYRPGSTSIPKVTTHEVVFAAICLAALGSVAEGGNHA